MSYWDTSALGKLYFSEADSSNILGKAGNETILVTSRLALIEMRRVAFRKEMEGFILAGAADAILHQMKQDVISKQIRIIEIDAGLEAHLDAVMASCYRRTPPLPLRSLDAIHLATAQFARETEIVATDQRLREAAKLLGFSLFPA